VTELARGGGAPAVFTPNLSIAAVRLSTISNSRTVGHREHARTWRVGGGGRGSVAVFIELQAQRTTQA